jgi:calcium-dependent protein kinase
MHFLWLCSGTITVEEMREGLRKKGGRIPETELQRIMDLADVNGDGRVDYEEFLAATLNLNKLEREDIMYRTFQVSASGGESQAQGLLLFTSMEELR